ncbi:30S ribosomal protein S17 [Candidatus Gracilibacteria bacterium]|nr:30S ribosomal protein S17 [Candidatus Gracilibacteria bacterium]
MITKKGSIVKISGKKTVKVAVNEYRMHPKYKKQFRITKNFLVHDESETAKVGDEVVIQQARPVSKRKSWVLVDSSKN